MEEAKKIKREKAKQNMSEGTGIYSAESGPLWQKLPPPHRYVFPLIKTAILSTRSVSTVTKPAYLLTQPGVLLCR